MEFNLFHQKALQKICFRQNLKNLTENVQLQAFYIKEERWKSSIEISAEDYIAKSLEYNLHTEKQC